MPTTTDLASVPSDWIPAALADIGLATIAADPRGLVLFMNPVAEAMTGVSSADAFGQSSSEVFRIVHETTRRPMLDAISAVFAGGAAVPLSDHTILISANGNERRIDHGAAPMRDDEGEIVGAILVFCDVGERQRIVQGTEDARAFAEGIVRTVREPLVVLDAELRVQSANSSFYRTFRLDAEQTEGRRIEDVGDRSWDIPELRERLERVLSRESRFDDFEVDRDFEEIGRRVMNLNARRLPPTGGRSELILLAIEDVTERRRTSAALEHSESRYRRLFETAQDGILLVDPDSRKIFDSNPFLSELLGYSHAELLDRELWEIGLFDDIESNKRAFRTLQEKGYIRYDDLPLRTHDDRSIEVEFVSNVYPVGDTLVIQCNIRDVTDRKYAEEQLRLAHVGLELRVVERTAELAHTNGTLKQEIARRETAETARRDLQQKLTTVQEEERRRIARELHDQLGQHLTAIGLGLKLVKDTMPNPSHQRDRLQNLLALTDRIGKEVHQLALELRPTALDDLGLITALANYLEGWSERSGVGVDFDPGDTDAERLPAAVETALYRVVQEALTNVLKHATANRVGIVLSRSPGHVSVVIEDDGCGFDADAVSDQRLGILGMRERVALFGGTLTVESAPIRGTAIIARIALSPKEEGDAR